VVNVISRLMWSHCIRPIYYKITGYCYHSINVITLGLAKVITLRGFLCTTFKILQNVENVCVNGPWQLNFKIIIFKATKTKTFFKIINVWHLDVKNSIRVPSIVNFNHLEHQCRLKKIADFWHFKSLSAVSEEKKIISWGYSCSLNLTTKFLLKMTWTQFYQHFTRAFFANILAPKNYKAKM